MSGDKKAILLLVVIFIVPIVASTVLYFTVTSFGVSPPPTKHIGVVCTKANATAYMCAVSSADTGTDFSLVSIEIAESSGKIIGRWPSPIAYAGGGVLVSNAVPPLAPTGRLVDNGDGMWGVGDTTYLSPVQGAVLTGCYIVLRGKGGNGSAPIG